MILKIVVKARGRGRSETADEESRGLNLALNDCRGEREGEGRR